MIRHPKFYLFDAGVYRTIRPEGPLDHPELIDGHAFETLFFQELRALNDYLSTGYQLYYWRKPTGSEVDFVLYGEKGILAFEVKREGKLRHDSLSGIKAFIKDYPEAKTYLVYLGDRVLREGQTSILPLKRCLADMPQILSNR